MQWHKFKTFGLFVILIGFGLPQSACSGRKARTCPAFSEAQRTGGTIDKNKKRRKRKVKQGVFDKKTSRRYRR